MFARLATATLFVCAVLVLAEPGTSQERPAKSPFAGDYFGPFITKSTRPRSGDNKGNYDLSIAADGKLKGHTHSTRDGVRMECTGSVDREGKMLIVLKYGRQEYMMKGTVEKTAAGHLKGILLQYAGREVIAEDEIDLRPK